MYFWTAVAAACLQAAALPTMPLSAVSVGQRGECHTVFVGSTVEPVPFEVRGVMPNFLGPRRDLLLIRLLGDKAEFSGVASGMSGSPCHIDGHVVGALSYSFTQFGKEPIAGVTPIADMLDVLKLPTEPLPWRLGNEPPASRSAPRRPRKTHALLEQAFAAADARAQSEAAADWQALRDGRQSPRPQALPQGVTPLSVPLSVSGLRPRAAAHLGPYFASHGFALMQGAGASVAGGHTLPPPSSAPPLVPGGSVAAVLVHGDVDMAGTGTVSWIDNDRVLAFGHPFFGVGPISAPMAQAHILQILASSQHSQKLPVTQGIVGEFTQDRLSAIGGQLGAAPRMVTVSGHVRDGNTRSPFTFHVLRDAFWTPRFLGTALLNAIDGRVDKSTRGSVIARSTIRFAGEAPLTLTMRASAERGHELIAEPAFDVGEAFNALWQHGDTWPGDASVDIDVQYAPEVSEEHLEHLHLGRSVAAPKEQVHAVLDVHRRGAAIEQVPVHFEVPSLPDGAILTVSACEGGLADLLDDAALGRPPLERRAQIIKWYAGRRTPGELYVQLHRLHGSTHQVQGQRLANLPPSVAASLGGAGSHDGNVESMMTASGPDQHVARPTTVRGCVFSSLVVERPCARVRSAKP